MPVAEPRFRGSEVTQLSAIIVSAMYFRGECCFLGIYSFGIFSLVTTTASESLRRSRFVDRSKPR